MHKRADCHLPANYILCDQSSVCLSCTEIVYCSEICKMSGSYYRMMTPGCSKICPQALFTRKKAPLNFLLFFMRILIQCFLFCLSFLILSETLWREAWGEIHLLLVALVVCFFHYRPRDSLESSSFQTYCDCLTICKKSSLEDHIVWNGTTDHLS